MASNSKLLQFIATFALFVCFIPSIAGFDSAQFKDKYSCVASNTDFGGTPDKDIGNARIKERKFPPIVEFDANIPLKLDEDGTAGQIMGLIPCKNKSDNLQFIVRANYSAAVFGRKIERVQVQQRKEGSEEEEENAVSVPPMFVPSCQYVFNKTVNTHCIPGKEEVMCDEKRICTSTFNLTCNLEGYVAQIKGHPKILLFKGTIAVNGPTPCNFKFQAPEDFQLLIMIKGGIIVTQMEECLKQLENRFICDNTKVENGTATTTTMNVTVTMNGTDTEATTATAPPKKKTSIAECLHKWPFLTLFAVATIILVTIIVLIVVLVVCKCSKASDASVQKGAGVAGSREQQQLQGSGVVIGSGEEDIGIGGRKINDDEDSYRMDKSEWMGRHEPNVKNDMTLINGTNGDEDYDLVDDDLYVNGGADGVDVPPTREDNDYE